METAERSLKSILQEKINNKIESRQATVEKMLSKIENEGRLMNDFIVPLGKDGKVKWDSNGRIHMRMVNDPSSGAQNPFFEMHPHALSQSCEKLGIPPAYIKGIQGSEWGRQLTAKILNEHTDNTTRQRLLVRTIEGQVRGVLSDSYRRLNTPKIFGQFIKGIAYQGAKIIDVFSDDTRAYLETINPQLIEIPTERNGIIHLAYGLRISSSDYGDGALEIRAFMMQAICLNGMVTEKVMKTIHLGSKLPDDLEVSQKTYQLDTETQGSLAYDMAKQLLSPQVIQQKIEAIQLASSKEVNIEHEITKIAKAGLISKVEGEEIKAVLMNNKPEDGVAGESSLWKLAQGVGAVARGKDERRMRELQEVAGAYIVSKN